MLAGIKFICSDRNAAQTNLSNLLLIVINCSGLVCWFSQLHSEVEKPLLTFRGDNFKKDLKKYDHHIADLRKQLASRYAGVEKVRPLFCGSPLVLAGSPKRFGTAAPVFVYSRDCIRKSLSHAYTAAYCAADRLPPSGLLHE